MERSERVVKVETSLRGNCDCETRRYELILKMLVNGCPKVANKSQGRADEVKVKPLSVALSF
jgi:hypothetical protein